jgi:hypothetical protein
MTRRRNFGFAGAAGRLQWHSAAPPPPAAAWLPSRTHSGLWLLHAMLLLLLRAAACDAGEQQATHAAVWV